MNKLDWKKYRILLALAVFPMNAKWVHKVDSCKDTPDEKTSPVIILKQWHLPPSVNTHDSGKNVSPLPQSKNQKEIFEQLSDWVKKKNIDTVIAEGCEGEITPEFKDVFQGWTYADLSSHQHDKNFADILSHEVIKLKVLFPKEINATCGDNLAEIKKGQLALSDSRADVGYLTRISENQNNPEKLKMYLSDVMVLYPLKPNADAKDAMTAISLDLKQSIRHFQDSNYARDLSFFEKASSSKSKKPVVIVVGGLHAEDLKKILEDKKMNCMILEPTSYQNDEEALTQKLNALIH